MKEDITPRNEKGQRHGYWERYWSNGKLWHKGNYINGKCVGYWEFHYLDGGIMFKEYFI